MFFGILLSNDVLLKVKEGWNTKDLLRQKKIHKLA